MALNVLYYTNESMPIEEDPFDGFDSEEERNFYHLYRSISTFTFVMDVIEFFLGLGVIFLDICLIFVMMRNKRLRACKTNKFVLNYAIFNLLSFISHPILEIVLEVSGLWAYFGWVAYCIGERFEDSMIIGLFLCSFALAFEWFITVYYNSNVNQSILQIYSYSLIIIYALVPILYVLYTTICFQDIIIITILINTILYVILLIFMLYCHYLKWKMPNPTRKKTFSLNIATVMTICWLPLFAYHIISMFKGSYTIRFLILVTYFIPECLAYGSPIIVFTLLGRLNKYYKVAFIQSCCCCCCKSARNYSGDDGSFEESEDEEKEITDEIVNKA